MVDFFLYCLQCGERYQAFPHAPDNKIACNKCKATGGAESFAFPEESDLGKLLAKASTLVEYDERLGDEIRVAIWILPLQQEVDLLLDCLTSKNTAFVMTCSRALGFLVEGGNLARKDPSSFQQAMNGLMNVMAQAKSGKVRRLIRDRILPDIARSGSWRQRTE